MNAKATPSSLTLDPLLLQAVREALSPLHTPDTWRAADASGQAPEVLALWQAQGFEGLIRPESHNGAGLALNQLFDVWALLGEWACPLPLGLGLVAQALHQAHPNSPTPPVLTTVAPQLHIDASGTWHALAVPWGRTAQAVLFEHDQQLMWLPTEGGHQQASGRSDRLHADWQWPQGAAQAQVLGPAVGLTALGAVVLAAHMAGALSAVLHRTVNYANERQQFGRPIGKFQAIQHHIAVMAEHTHAVHLATQTAVAHLSVPAASGVPVVSPSLAALAKARASEAVPLVCNLAHAVHGAMGITAEYPLHHHTRRLHAWRLDFGAESHWQRVLGEAWLASGESSLDFLLNHLSLETPS